MKVDVLIAEIGSTTTVINAFDRIRSALPVFLGQGQARTSVSEGNVVLGLELALAELCRKLGVDRLDCDLMLATSSAAGGLRMTVHGLVYEMTVRAAREAALGSGGIVRYVTAGRLRAADLRKVAELRPNLILLAGGTDYGESETAVANYRVLLAEVPEIPVIYAGNIQNQETLRELARQSGCELYLTENVYPSLDRLNIEPTRQLIHQVFERHIVDSPGMQTIRERVGGSIVPTPGAVMESAQLAAGMLGDVMVFDVGGATTDVYSVTDGSAAVREVSVAAEPFAKRTVEGDLGVFVNRRNLVALFKRADLLGEFPQIDYYLEHARELPADSVERALVARLTEKAVQVALDRHAGEWIDYYLPTGRKRLAKGKDLTAVKWIILTGGALLHLNDPDMIIRNILNTMRRDKLIPQAEVKVLCDRYYIMASLGVLAKTEPEAARRLLRQSLGLPGEAYGSVRI